MLVHLLKGDDPTLLADAVSELVHELAGDDGALAIEDLTGDDVTIDAVVDACQTPPFLGSRRVVVVRDIGRFRADELAPLLTYLEHPLDTTALVLVAGGGQTSTKLVNAVKKIGNVHETGAGTAKARDKWVADRVKQAPVHLDAPARAHITAHLGEDVGRLGSILDALASAYGQDAKIGLEELEPFLGESGSVAPWDLTDAIDRGDAETALTQLHRLMGAGERHPLVILATLHRHYSAMLRLDGAGVNDEREAAELLGTSPYPAKKALTQSRRLGRDGVARAITLLADADLALRGAQAWPGELVLEVLVARLCHLARRAGARR